ncbi:24664_t:CDS:2 [Cetraspora pellucida]|uniref:24664_t:CDS:1 n=1 Tax=Cetraspora pellucida TaxID=1433469 RepID=A0A9N9EJQ9_9GLOM|nr:24664_t:CDS:2 [Cetraspora pellucida]
MGVDIAKAIEECFRSTGIISKIIAIMHDNASANDKFLQEFSDSLFQTSISFDATQQSVQSTIEMSKQKYPTLSMAISFYYLLIEMLKKAIEKKDTPQWLIKECEAAMANLLDYCKKTNMLGLAAVILDSCLKLNIINKYETEYAPFQDTTHTIRELSEKNILSCIYKRLHFEQRSELESYLFVPSVYSNTNILE